MSIAGYEAFVCVCFFVYKTLCAAVHMAAVGHLYSPLYVRVYTVGKKFIQKIYLQKVQKKHFKNEQKVGMLLQKEQIQEE